jgi:leucyl/phenylalanyl-tRNA--protein transferase
MNDGDTLLEQGVKLEATSPDEGSSLQRWALSEEPPRGSDAQWPSSEMLLWAYGHGIFPMADPDKPPSKQIDWYFPDPRGILPIDVPIDSPGGFHVPRNVARALRNHRFEIRCDRAFEVVMRACASPRDDHDDQSWIDHRLITAYGQLHELGFAHSIEAWLGTELVGGLYGVHIGGAFFGESMFSRPQAGGSNSSKICLVQLVRWLQIRGFTLLDTQFTTPHLAQFGCIEIPADEYLLKLNAAIRKDRTWGTFTALE